MNDLRRPELSVTWVLGKGLDDVLCLRSRHDVEGCTVRHRSTHVAVALALCFGHATDLKPSGLPAQAGRSFDATMTITGSSPSFFRLQSPAQTVYW